MVFTRWSRRTFSATVADVARPSVPQPSLARAIRQLRQERGETQEDLAHASGITVTALVRIEGAKANPTWATVGKLAAGLGVSIGQIADLADRLAAGDGQ
jgi:transcriptional regulator with XRE-family HTH domain